MTYSARAKTDAEVLTISLDNLNKYREKNSMKELDKAIVDFEDNYIKKRELHVKHQQMFFLDYQRVGTKIASDMVLPRDPVKLMSSAIYRCRTIIKYHYKKENPFKELIAELKSLEQTEQS